MHVHLTGTDGSLRQARKLCRAQVRRIRCLRAIIVAISVLFVQAIVTDAKTTGQSALASEYLR